MAAITTYALSGHPMRGLVARVTAAVGAANARARARHDYRRLLANEELLGDIGVSRQDVRKALSGLGG